MYRNQNRSPRRALVLAAALALVATLALAPAAFADEAYLHIRIVDAGGATSNINLAASTLGSNIPGLDAGMLQDGRIQIEGAEVDLYKLRQLWIAMRDLQDATFVSIDSDTDSLRLLKEDGFLVARSTPKTAEGRKLEARIPGAAVDALLSGADNEINIAAAIQTLAGYGGQDLFTLNDKGTKIRVWVDWNPEG
jgi:hypothetical protein